MNRRLRIYAGSFLAAAALAIGVQPANAKWVASWSAAPHPPPAPGARNAAASFDDVTLSQILRISEGGESVRVRFTNRYGPGPLAIGEARIVLIDDAGAEVPGTSRPLTFGGEAGATIPRGAPFVSDEAAMDLPDLSRVKVEFYLPEETGPCTCHSVGLDTLAVSATGNHVGDQWVPASEAQYRAFLSGVEVFSPESPGTIVAFGDSITDGVGSTARENRRWPDIFANRLQDAGMEYAVANSAISGNRVLSSGAGESALARFDEDVLSLPNVTHLIIFEGVNDLGNRFGPRPANGAARPQAPVSEQPQIDAEQMIDGFRQLIARAHDKGIEVIGSPIGPYKGAGYWSEEGEAARQEINDWIINSGEFDSVVRLDTAFADPQDPAQMREGYHIGDFLHGNDAGLQAVAESIDLSLFQPDAED